MKKPPALFGGFFAFRPSPVAAAAKRGGPGTPVTNVTPKRVVKLPYVCDTRAMTNTTTLTPILPPDNGGHRPPEFVGSMEQRLVNAASHNYFHPENRCAGCDCRPWGTWATWGCENLIG